jgi:hypothetical protein
MVKTRSIHAVIKSKPTLEGAGVHLNRVFGFAEAPKFDPFLLLDDFRSGNPAHYLKGFPWHPHRGIETITYMLGGMVEHGDSMGNQGRISPGDVQWMTAGSGIIHQEMPKGDPAGYMGGFQLWANLPASRKMMDPRYRDVKSSQIPHVSPSRGVRVRIICGDISGVQGPVIGIITDPEYLDVTMEENAEFVHPVKRGYTALAYVIDGEIGFGGDRRIAENGSLAVLTDGEQITAFAAKISGRFLLLIGKPIGESVAWRGPIVMNTQDELRLAFEEYENGTFIKHR